MPQFAVIARYFHPSTASERAIDLDVIASARSRLRKLKPVEYIFGPAKAYLVQADTAQAAMDLIEVLVAENGTQIMVHRALEVAESLPAKLPKIARAGQLGGR